MISSDLFQGVNRCYYIVKLYLFHSSKLIRSSKCFKILFSEESVVRLFNVQGNNFELLKLNFNMKHLPVQYLIV